jgi:oligopeptide/dipeptide ABC transporter ATP-binding protein
MRQYPHELSGGMRQRAMIAMALLCAPDLLIADEPTTALDVTVQAQIFEIMRDLKRELMTSVIIISHDMSVIAGIADRVAIMREGTIVETGPTDAIYYRPQHPYTKSLVQVVPRIVNASGGRKLVAVSSQAVLEVKNLQVRFSISSGVFPFGRRKSLVAVDGVSFAVAEGETLGIVGESGCGKSTLARALLQLLPGCGGTVVWCGRDLARLGNDIRKLRKQFQIVFQDPLASLDPRRTVGQSIAEPLYSLAPELSRAEVEGRVRETMARVGLEPGWINRYPHEFSGGQNQRVGIARAIIVKPRLLICDEAVSALDVSIQTQVIDLITSLQSELLMSMIFISHDLSVVRRVADRVMVLYLGRVVELGSADAIYNDPRHPYTRALLDAVPVPDPDVERARSRTLLIGEVRSPLDTRASLAFMKSRMIDDPDAEQYRPQLLEIVPGHFVAEFDGMRRPFADAPAKREIA